MIDIYNRYQKGLTLKHLFPIRNDGFCACGCNHKLSGRKRRWATEKCQEKAVTAFYIIKGDSNFIRQKLFEKENGYCRSCGVFCDNWQADHIIPVFLGGSACGLDNFQTLCPECHKEKSYTDGHLKTISSQAACMLSQRRLFDFGAISCEFPKQSIEIQSLISASSASDTTCVSVNL